METASVATAAMAKTQTIVRIKVISRELSLILFSIAECFIRSLDTNRLFDSIVRDSLTVRSIGECEIECVKARTFTCRSFSFRYGAKTSGTIIDNCQLSDWPVRDMDKNRHLIDDKGFDVFERASYGKGCEIQPFEHDHDAHDKNQKCKLDWIAQQLTKH